MNHDDLIEKMNGLMNIQARAMGVISCTHAFTYEILMGVDKKAEENLRFFLQDLSGEVECFFDLMSARNRKARGAE